jgi:hypothetical protein
MTKTFEQTPFPLIRTTSRNFQRGSLTPPACQTQGLRGTATDPEEGRVGRHPGVAQVPVLSLIRKPVSRAQRSPLCIWTRTRRGIRICRKLQAFSRGIAITKTLRQSTSRVGKSARSVAQTIPQTRPVCATFAAPEGAPRFRVDNRPAAQSGAGQPRRFRRPLG